ncbi:MAG: hypothetical protein NC920_03135 [Candidatus Omnitrophica bacterium]|nr:hypothetical protein [Candidatus Omnitrophota bacterium]
MFKTIFSFLLVSILLFLFTFLTQAQVIEKISVGPITLRAQKGWNRAGENYVATSKITLEAEGRAVELIPATSITYNPKEGYLAGKFRMSAPFTFSPTQAYIRIGPGTNLLFIFESGFLLEQLPGGLKAMRGRGTLWIDFSNDKYIVEGEFGTLNFFDVINFGPQGSLELTIDKKNNYYLIDGRGELSLAKIIGVPLDGKLKLNFATQEVEVMGSVGLKIAELLKAGKVQAQLAINLGSGKITFQPSGSVGIALLKFVLADFKGVIELNYKDLYRKGVDLKGSAVILNYNVQDLSAHYDLQNKVIAGNLTASLPLIQGLSEGRALTLPFRVNVSLAQSALEITATAVDKIKEILLAGYRLKPSQLYLKQDGIHISGDLVLPGFSPSVNVVVSPEGNFSAKGKTAFQASGLQVTNYNYQFDQTGIHGTGTIEKKEYQINILPDGSTLGLPTSDLAISNLEVPSEVVVGENVRISVGISNNSSRKVENCSLNVAYIDTATEYRYLIYQGKISLEANSCKGFSFNWQPQNPGNFKIEAEVIPPSGIPDNNLQDNTARQEIRVKKSDKIEDIRKAIKKGDISVIEALKQNLISPEEAINQKFISVREAIEKNLISVEEALKNNFITIKQALKENLINLNQAIAKGYLSCQELEEEIEQLLLQMMKEYYIDENRIRFMSLFSSGFPDRYNFESLIDNDFYNYRNIKLFYHIISKNFD